MAVIGDALRLAFMQKHEYARLRDEENAWGKLQKPLISLSVALISLSVLVSTVVGFILKQHIRKLVAFIELCTKRSQTLGEGSFYKILQLLIQERREKNKYFL
ncbi:hypothetical protein ACJIZ3_001565 [Penstemon smallii]|uniref:Uncharacterized protein n=1 Tax=Penstemon smallii TaxID=265156 RepID=A0ABD3U736_9LAMI